MKFVDIGGGFSTDPTNIESEEGYFQIVAPKVNELLIKNFDDEVIIYGEPGTYIS